KPALWPTLVLPFAAAPATGDLPDAGADSELSLRLLLTGLERLIGTLAERSTSTNRPPFACVLPLSPNHGTFGGDGGYGAAKAGLASIGNRWASEHERWGRATRIVLATIGWVRGTGLMGENDTLAQKIEADYGIRTYTADEMAALLLAATSPGWIGRADQAPVQLDLSGGLTQLGNVAGILKSAAESAHLLEDPLAGNVQEQATPYRAQALPEDGIPALANLPRALLPTIAENSSTESYSGVPASDMVVIVGVAEQGPWGSSATRQAAEIGDFSTASLVELAWRSGLVKWDSQKATWLDADDGKPVGEFAFAEKYEQALRASCGLRPMTESTSVHPHGTLAFAEVFVDKAVSLSVTSEQQAVRLASDIAEAAVRQDESGGWQLQLPAGARIRVPHRRPLQRSVAGQFPNGSDPARHGLDPAVVAGMDPLAAWNLVTTAEAFAQAGLSPAELHEAVHPTMIGNTQGSGMGGMASIKSLYVDPMVGTEHANDLLQEALGNVVSAHTNTELAGGYGPMVHPVAACATAAVSLEEAVDKIRLGKAEFVVAGGWDDLSDEGINGFADMSATADNAALTEAGIPAQFQSRPGDRRRGGFVEAQGGGSFLVCSGAVALRLGLPVRAVVAYAGSFGDGINASIPAPGLGAIGAATGGADSPLMTSLSALGLTVDDIEVVSKHDTATAANDPNEAQIHTTIQSALGRTPGAPLRVISQKSLTGHAKGGAAAWQIAGLCDVFESNVIPGNQSLTCVDPEVVPGDWLTVDYRPLHRARPVQAALLTSLGFGHVSAVVAVVHPDIFISAIPEHQQAGYLQRAQERRAIGAITTLAARHGRASVLQRQTYRGFPEGDGVAESELLLDPKGRIDLQEQAPA
ncbi:MAG: 3-oxoacyl-ACP synthase, partial [Actinomycetia bacterium]|nr:3-oxoacyl-ACP synthase [Actinomycetes bacterium]